MVLKFCVVDCGNCIDLFVSISVNSVKVKIIVKDAFFEVVIFN